MTIPWTTILAVLGDPIVVGLGAALLPAARAARLNTLSAMAAA